MVDDQRSGDEAEAVVDEAADTATEGDDPSTAEEDHPFAAEREDDSDALAEEAEAVIEEEPATDSAFDFGADVDGPTDDARTSTGEAGASDGATARGRPDDGGDRPRSKAELDRELEEMTIDAGESPDETTAEPGRKRTAPESEATAGSETVTEQRTAGDEDETDPALAGVLSFLVPGLGNVYNGQTGRGAVVLAIWAAWLLLGWGLGGLIFGIFLGALTYGVMFLLTGFVLLVVEFVGHLFAAYDAYNQAEKINAGRVDV